MYTFVNILKGIFNYAFLKINSENVHLMESIKKTNVSKTGHIWDLRFWSTYSLQSYYKTIQLLGHAY